MKILSHWLRTYLPTLPPDLTDRQLADDLTLRGIAVEGVHDLGPGNGHLFEMDITTNRVDAMNHYGIAREIAAIYNLPLPPLDPTLTALSSRPEQREVERPASPPTPAHTPFPIRIDPSAANLCGRFTAQVLRNVVISPSTGQTFRFFRLLGQKHISNAVDASNFTLLGMGQPTHAFDLDKIDGGLIIRLARAGEKLRLLDGTERTLDPDDLVIADHHKPLSLAGVMGGLDSSVTASTRNLLIESAWFDPAAIRRSSRRHLLHTDASHRFERGADLNAAPLANHLVASLILEYGGTLDGPLLDITSDLTSPALAQLTSDRPPITLSVREVQRHLGRTLDDTGGHSALTPDLISQILTALGCRLTPTPNQSPENATFLVHLPSWRLDLTREIDLIEEIARVFGYNRFANTLPTALPVQAHPTAAPERAIRSRLLALGYSEAISSTFASSSQTFLFAPEPASFAHSHVPMENPLSEEASNLRPSLLPGMLSMLALNLNRDVLTVRLFEAGHVFSGTVLPKTTTLADVHQTSSLALGLTGPVPPAAPLHDASASPIFELKGVIESLASLFTLPGGPSALTFSAANPPAWLDPNRAATALLGNTPIAHFGELAHAESSRRKLRQPVFLAEIHLAHLLSLPLRSVTARELSRFQAVERDFSFVLPDSVAWHTVQAALLALSLPELIRITPIEVWRNPEKFPNVYSLLLRTVFQSDSRTLRDEDLTLWSNRILEALTALGGTHRA